MANRIVNIQGSAAKQAEVAAMVRMLDSRDGEVTWTDRLAAGQKPGGQKPVEA